ncbi:DMT family transporter [Azohydromonas caseinilytica]|uniref:DMT family transporter n=1 Tax=Azohydromonas caseinilytica TaxID=2728836 RepID=A0A848F8S8_9BURK|nr:DMT family transporter [Azohydromonas caseinilytica]NML15762.1 DMT family transporter [Azohydromonas caseinilytica]
MTCAASTRPAATAADFFTLPRNVFLLATLCCLLWGSAYPAIKNGYELFAIGAGDVPSKLVFAGYRFVLAGAALLALAALLRKDVLGPLRRQWGMLTALGFAQTTLQYIFFYVGLAYTTGVKGSIMNATGTFFSVLLAHFLYHNDRLSARKLLGCLVGFAGVMVVNFQPALLDFEFTLLGEGFIVIAAFVLSAASIYGKRVSQRMDAMVMTGWQLAIGGVLLLALGYGAGGTLTGFTPASTALLLYLALLSSAAFALWSMLLKHNRVSLVTAFNFLVPIFGALLSALFLNESILEWKNALALLLVCWGIWMVTQEAATVTSSAARPAR